MPETFRYRPRATPMILSGGFFALCAAFFVYLALRSDRGLRINRIIELEPGGAAAFFAVMAVLSALFVVAAVMGLIHGARHEPVLTLADDHVLVPGGFLCKKPRRIDLATVTNMMIESVHGQRFLTVWSAQGKVSIARSLLDSDETFERIMETMRDRSVALRAAQPR